MSFKQSISLSTCQEKAVDSIAAAFQYHGPRSVLIEGPAGCGKTTALGVALRDVPASKVVCAAPTHRAAKQFENSLKAQGLSLDVRTCHSLLKVGMKQNPETGLMENNRSKTFKLNDDVRVVLLDEASMISEWMVERLLSGFSTVLPQAVVALGDRAQLPPVGSGRLNWLFEEPDDVVRMTQVQRHQGPILDTARKIRAPGLELPTFTSERTDDSSVQVIRSYARFAQEFQSTLREAQRSDGLLDTRLLSYRNVKVDDWAWFARQTIHRAKTGVFDWRVGDYVTNCDPLMDAFGNEIALPHNSELEIVAVGAAGKIGRPDIFMADIPEPYAVVELTVREVYGGETFDVLALQAKDVQTFKEHQSRMKAFAEDPANHKDPDVKSVGYGYTRRSQVLTTLQPLYATTVHKSQGSTFDSVFVNLSDPLALCGKGVINKQLLKQLAYVAASRASKRLVIFDPRPPKN